MSSTPSINSYSKSPPSFLEKSGVTTTNLNPLTTHNPLVKAKEMEDIDPPKPLRSRRLSVSSKPVLWKKEDLETAAWECVDRITGKNRIGFVYKFKLRDAYNPEIPGSISIKTPQLSLYKDKLLNLAKNHYAEYPAIAPTYFDSIATIDKKDLDRANKVKMYGDFFFSNFFPFKDDPVVSDADFNVFVNSVENRYNMHFFNIFYSNYQDLDDLNFKIKYANLLGIKSEKTQEGIFMYMPDKDALKYNYEQLRKMPGLSALPDISILDANGALNDEDFIWGFLTHTITLSSSKEFLHDGYLHVLPTLLHIIKTTFSNPVSKGSSSDYNDQRWSYIKNNVLPYLKIVFDLKIGQTKNSLTKKELEDKEYVKQLKTTISHFIDVITNSNKPIHFSYAINIQENFFKGALDSVVRKYVLEKTYGKKTIKYEDMIRFCTTAIKNADDENKAKKLQRLKLTID